MSAPKTPRGIRINPNISETHLPGSTPVAYLLIAEIKRNPDIQQRAGGVSDALVREYTETIGEWIERAPLTVYRDGDKACHWLADGFHRVEAAAQAGLQAVPCVVDSGGYRDALLFACGANATHGARSTREDRRRAAETLLKDPEWSCWSDRKIAETAGVSPTMVGKWRAQLSNLDSCQSPDTNPAAAVALAEARETWDASPSTDAAPIDAAAPAEALPCTEAAPIPKRIGRDGKARAMPAPKTPETITDSEPGYPKVHAVEAGKLIKQAQRLAVAIGEGASLDNTLEILEVARVIADRLLDRLLRLRDQGDRAQARLGFVARYDYPSGADAPTTDTPGA